MKTILLFILLSPFIATAQKAEVPEKTNRITVVNNKTAEQNFILAKRLIAEKGLEIKFQDKDVFQITTGYDSSISPVFTYYILYCKDNQIVINGKYKYFDNLNYAFISKTGGKNTASAKAFDQMYSFASELGTDMKFTTVGL